MYLILFNMNTVFLRDFSRVIQKHPDSWNKPCLLPRDADCGTYIDKKSIFRVDSTMKVIEWKVNGNKHWTHFDEIYISSPTKILNKTYVGNVKEVV